MTQPVHSHSTRSAEILLRLLPWMLGLLAGALVVVAALPNETPGLEKGPLGPAGVVAAAAVAAAWFFCYEEWLRSGKREWPGIEAD